MGFDERPHRRCAHEHVRLRHGRRDTTNNVVIYDVRTVGSIEVLPALFIAVAYEGTIHLVAAKNGFHGTQCNADAAEVAADAETAATAYGLSGFGINVKLDATAQFHHDACRALTQQQSQLNDSMTHKLIIILLRMAVCGDGHKNYK